MSSLAYFNDTYTPLKDIAISPFDRGFLFADGAYEVLKAFDKHPFKLDAHYERLCASLAKLAIAMPLTGDAFEQVVTKLLAHAPQQNSLFYIQITRGTSHKREHLPSTPLSPTVFAYTAPYALKTIEERANGGIAYTQPDTRWQNCDIKSTNLLGNVMALQASRKKNNDVFEALLVKDQLLQEGTASSIFLEKSGALYTPPLSQNILDSITRRVVMDIALDLNVPVHEKSISVDDALSADNLWVVSTTKEIHPITFLDEKPIANAKASALWHQFITTYKSLWMKP